MIRLSTASKSRQATLLCLTAHMLQVVPGAYISAGRQGSLRKGEVQAPRNLPSNPETLQSSAYRSLPVCVVLCTLLQTFLQHL